MPRVGPALLDPPDAFEAQCEEAALEDFELSNAHLLAGFVLAVASVVLAALTTGPYEPEISQGIAPLRKPVTVVRLVYPLPEIKGKVWDPVVRPAPRWMRIGSAQDHTTVT